MRAEHFLFFNTENIGQRVGTSKMDLSATPPSQWLWLLSVVCHLPVQ